MQKLARLMVIGLAFLLLAPATNAMKCRGKTTIKDLDRNDCVTVTDPAIEELKQTDGSLRGYKYSYEITNICDGSATVTFFDSLGQRKHWSYIETT